MKFSPELGKEILAYLAFGGGIQCGVSCAFFPISNKIGVKVFGEEYSKARFAFEEQTKASKLGLAPNTGDFFKIALRTGSHSYTYIYGYLTEIASGVGDTPEKSEQLELWRKMSAAGYETWDVGTRNCGWITRNGKALYVCIDFDPKTLCTVMDRY